MEFPIMQPFLLSCYFLFSAPSSYMPLIYSLPLLWVTTFHSHKIQQIKL